MIFTEYLLYSVSIALITALIARFIRKAIRRWSWNRAHARFGETLKRYASLGIVQSAIETRKKLGRRLK